MYLVPEKKIHLHRSSCNDEITVNGTNYENVTMLAALIDENVFGRGEGVSHILGKQVAKTNNYNA